MGTEYKIPTINDNEINRTPTLLRSLVKLPRKSLPKKPINKVKKVKMILMLIKS